MEIGSRIKILRENRGLTQIELAKVLNIGNSTLSQYESGARVPSDDIKITIANYFDVSLDYLLGRTEQKEKPTPEAGSGLSDKDTRLIDWFHSLPQEKRKAILMLGEAPEGLDE